MRSLLNCVIVNFNKGSCDFLAEMKGESKVRTGKAVMEAMDRIFSKTPSFEDIFDEESFYLFAACFTCISVVAAFVASRYITLKERD